MFKKDKEADTVSLNPECYCAPQMAQELSWDLINVSEGLILAHTPISKVSPAILLHDITNFSLKEFLESNSEFLNQILNYSNTFPILPSRAFSGPGIQLTLLQNMYNVTVNFTNILDKHAPVKHKIVRGKNADFMTKELNEKIKTQKLIQPLENE